MTQQTQTAPQVTQIHDLYDKEIEKQVLGSLMYFSKIDEVYSTIELLQPDDFYDLQHQEVFHAIRDLVMNDINPEIPMVWDKLKTGDYKYMTKDNQSMLSKLCDMALITSFQLEKYAQIVKRYSILRKTMYVLGKGASNLEKEQDPIEYLAKVEADILGVMGQISEIRPSNVLGIIEEVDKDIKDNETLGKVGFTTGFSMLDKKLGALQPTHVWVVGAYTGHGKSHFLNQIILNCLEDNEDASIVLFSTEMDRKDIMLRLIANLAKMPVLKIKKGMLNEDEQKRKVAAYERIRKYEGRLTIYDNCYSIDEIRLRAKKEKIHSKMNIMVVDFVQNVKAKGDIYERMSRVALELQTLAKELKCAIILASQISQEGQRMGADSGVISYKGAGEIAAISDVSLLLVNQNDNPDHTSVVRKLVKVKKARHAPTGWEMPILFDGMNGGAMWQDDEVVQKEKTNKTLEEVEKIFALEQTPIPWYKKD